MRYLLLISVLVFTGCSGLRVQADDSLPTQAGKVAVRALLFFPTVGLLEECAQNHRSCVDEADPVDNVPFGFRFSCEGLTQAECDVHYLATRERLRNLQELTDLPAAMREGRSPRSHSEVQ